MKMNLSGWAWVLACPVCAAAQPPDAPKSDLPEISWEAAREHIGKKCAVTGKVVMTRNIGSRCFLNFHENFRDNFTVVINRDSFDRFPEPPETLFADKRVKVIGEIIEYQGKPEIVVTGPEQIFILDGPTTALAPALVEGGTTTRPVQAAPDQPPTSHPAAPFSGVVTLATYNVLNLFDEHDDPYHSDEGTPAKPKDEREKLAASLHRVNADVVALQEVENRGVLEEFNRSMLADLNYGDVVLFEGNDERGIDVAVLSRLPVGPVTSHRHLTFKNSRGETQSFRRDLLRVRIEPPGAPAFDVFATHLKSRRDGDESTVIRMAEAGAARALLDEALRDDPQALFVFCGDLNDTFDSEPIRTLVGSGPNALQSFFKDVPESERKSYNRAPYESMIDFILASPAMAKRYEAGSYTILAGSVETSGSDHNPVVAKFKIM